MFKSTSSLCCLQMNVISTKMIAEGCATAPKSNNGQDLWIICDSAAAQRLNKRFPSKPIKRRDLISSLLEYVALQQRIMRKLMFSTENIDNIVFETALVSRKILVTDGTFSIHFASTRRVCLGILPTKHSLNGLLYLLQLVQQRP